MTETTIQPLIADPKHQANDSLRGYRYQILHSVHAWLSLADDEILYLEGAEDFDIVSPETTTVVQVKDAQRNITLRSQEVNDAINRYWKLRDNHPNRSVTFRFRTRSQIVVEQGDPLRENQAGLHIWNCTAIGNLDHCLNQDCDTMTIRLKGDFDGKTKKIHCPI